MNERQAAPPEGETRFRYGALFAGIWLIALTNALTTLLRRGHDWQQYVGLAALGSFCVLYLTLVVVGGRARREMVHRPLGRRWAELILMVGLVALMVPGAGQEATAGVLFCGAAAVMTLPLRQGLVAAAVLALATEVLPYLAPGWQDRGDGVGVLLAGAATWGIRLAFERNQHLLLAQQELARLAVETERARIAADLHDILGHSLTVVTVKAELAQRLLDVDVERARSELADLETLSRDALADVCSTALGVRGVSLPGEIAAARSALSAAGIAAELPTAADEVPSRLRERFAWTIRETVTNLVRHSRASRCEIRLTPHSLEVLDDGVGAAAPSGGQGLVSLRARGGARRPAVGRQPARLARLRRPAGSAVTAPGGSPAAPIRLLLADDQALVRGAIAALLELEPDLTVVAEVDRGDEVLAAAHAHAVDVALLDVEMPGADGVTAARQLREALPGCRVLIVTTFGRAGYLRQALAAGASGFVVKDTPARLLADAVRRVHAGLRVVDPALAVDSLTLGQSPLTDRETQVLRAARDGGTVNDLAGALHLSDGTVRNHLSSVIGKTGARTRAEAVRIALDNGWLLG